MGLLNSSVQSRGRCETAGFLDVHRSQMGGFVLPDEVGGEKVRKSEGARERKEDPLKRNIVEED